MSVQAGVCQFLTLYSHFYRKQQAATPLTPKLSAEDLLEMSLEISVAPLVGQRQLMQGRDCTNAGPRAHRRNWRNFIKQFILF